MILPTTSEMVAFGECLGAQERSQKCERDDFAPS
jgi:hypothetical protein